MDDILVNKLRSAIPIVNGLGDMWPVFNDGVLFGEVVDALTAPYAGVRVTKVAGIEARGFVLGSAVARALAAGFVGIRKPGGLYPGATFERRTPPDYRGNEFVLRLQKSALNANDRVILVDDWFESGGQAKAAIELIADSGAEYLGSSIVVDWLGVETRAHLAPVHSVLDKTTLPSD